MENTKTMINAIADFLNETALGNELEEKLLEQARRKNMTIEELSELKQGFLMFLFSQAVQSNKDFMDIAAADCWNYIRGQA